jgi:putative transposase
MDERYLVAAARYVELTPVRAGLVADPAKWLWSSAIAHLKGKDDTFVTVTPLLELIGNWHDFIYSYDCDNDFEIMRCHERTGRPWVTQISRRRLGGYLNERRRLRNPGQSQR